MKIIKCHARGLQIKAEPKSSIEGLTIQDILFHVVLSSLDSQKSYHTNLTKPQIFLFEKPRCSNSGLRCFPVFWML